MYATSSFFQVVDRSANRERLIAGLARYGVSAAVLVAVMAGVVVGGLVPALPLDLAIVPG